MNNWIIELKDRLLACGLLKMNKKGNKMRTKVITKKDLESGFIYLGKSNIEKKYKY